MYSAVKRIVKSHSRPIRSGPIFFEIGSTLLSMTTAIDSRILAMSTTSNAFPPGVSASKMTVCIRRRQPVVGLTSL